MNLTPLADYILVTIRKECPALTSMLKTDCRSMKMHNKCEWADENAVMRTLVELEAAGLIQRTRPDANEWTRAEVVAPEVVKVKQGMMF